MSQYFLSAGGGGGGGGDVVGPASSTDNAIVRFDGTTGKLIQNGVATETDAGEILAGDGSQSNPAYSFVNDPSSGIYSGGVDDNYFVSGGVQVGSFNSVAFSLNAHAHMTNAFSYALIGTAASTTMPSNTSYVGVTDTTAPRTITLDPNLFPYYGVVIFVKDETGTAAANNITIDTFGGAYTIDGASTKTIDTDYGGYFIMLGTDGQFYTIAQANPAAPVGSGQPLQNLGFTWDGNVPATFTVTSANGTALSAGNKGWVSMPSNAANLYIGEVKNYDITADQSFTDTVAGDISGMLFGATTGVNWDEFCPFYMYAVSKSDDSDVVFMFSRIPGRSQSPASGNIGKAGAIVNNSEADFFCLANVTVADYAQTSCVCIGAFTMKFDGATDSWFVSENGLGYDFGVGVFGENTVFNYPMEQNGASTASHFFSTGTLPVFTQQNATYSITKDGYLTFSINYSIQTADGAMGDPVFYTAPLKNGIDYFSTIGMYRATSTTPGLTLNTLQNAGNNQGQLFFTGGSDPLFCYDLSAGDATGIFVMTIQYKLYPV